jgi:glutaredoxin 3|tara:strand:+ start:845 stop:1120 length:276 start_codon:yes stop_codon:yes gene_type:complete
MERLQQLLKECDTDFLVFTQTICAYCNRAKNVLKSKDFTFSEINLDQEGDLRFELVRSTGHRTVPICFDMRDEKPVFIGGSDHLMDYLRSN